MSLEVIDFKADWCGPCKQLEPHLEELEEKYADEDVEFVEVDVDSDSEKASRFGVRSIPTVIVREDDENVEQFTGAGTQNEIDAAISERL